VILSALPSYPTARSYVLKLHRDATPAFANLTGRLENVATGEVYEFSTAWELLACLARDVTTHGASPNFSEEL
jgi:hypothetical protein